MHDTHIRIANSAIKNDEAIYFFHDTGAVPSNGRELYTRLLVVGFIFFRSPFYLVRMSK